MTPAQRRARDGALFLDTKIPGWHDQIRLEGLNMEVGLSATPVRQRVGCVLCQLNAMGHGGQPLTGGDVYTGSYSLLADEILPERGRYTKSKELGFVETGTVTYKALTAAWKDEILARRNAA